MILIAALAINFLAAETASFETGRNKK